MNEPKISVDVNGTPKPCSCEELTGLGNVKSTRIQDIEYDVANLKKDSGYIRNLYDQMERLENRMHEVEHPTKFKDKIRRWIWNWLDWGN